jgi:hypothetical protein
VVQDGAAGDAGDQFLPADDVPNMSPAVQVHLSSALHFGHGRSFSAKL